MASSPYDEDLVQRAGRGDPLAAPMLVSILGDRLLGFARAIAPGLSDADREQIVELAVEAGVRAMRSYDPTKGSLFGWFRQQVRYQTRQWFRTHGTADALPSEIEDGVSFGPSDSWMDDPVVRDGLSEALYELSLDDRVILALRSAEGLAFAEIGVRLKIKESTARQRHKRALDRLRTAAHKNEKLLSRFEATPKGIRP